MTPETLGKPARRAEIDGGLRSGVSSEEMYYREQSPVEDEGLKQMSLH